MYTARSPGVVAAILVVLGKLEQAWAGWMFLAMEGLVCDYWKTRLAP